MSNLWTVKEAAPFLQISEWLLYDMVRKKQVPHIKVRAKVFFRQEALEKWMLEQEAASMAPVVVGNIYDSQGMRH